MNPVKPPCQYAVVVCSLWQAECLKVDCLQFEGTFATAGLASLRPPNSGVSDAGNRQSDNWRTYQQGSICQQYDVLCYDCLCGERWMCQERIVYIQSPIAKAGALFNLHFPCEFHCTRHRGSREGQGRLSAPVGLFNLNSMLVMRSLKNHSFMTDRLIPMLGVSILMDHV